MSSIDADLLENLAALLNYVQNVKVQAYNEGVDAERDRCIKAVARVMRIDPDLAGGEIFDALRLTQQDARK